MIKHITLQHNPSTSHCNRIMSTASHTAKPIKTIHSVYSGETLAKCKPNMQSPHLFPISRTSTINSKHYIDELVIEENGNELIAQNEQPSVTISCSKATNHDKQKLASSKKEAQFEYDMKKYGLQDNIVHIQRLNSKIADIIGPVSPPISTGSMFPFQRRNRSSSPQKESPFNNRLRERSGSPTPCKVKPSLSKNFVICSQCQGSELVSLYRKKARDEIYEKQSSDSLISTYQTEEDQKRNAEEQESWMYKTWNSKGCSNEVPINNKALNEMIGF